MLYERVYLRTLALYFLLFNFFFFLVWVAWSASYSKTLLFQPSKFTVKAQ